MPSRWKPLEKYIPANQAIDFMSIDVEGLDFNVLKSNDWKKYKPAIILIESLRSSLRGNLDSELNTYLVERNYELVAKTFNTLFYKISMSSANNATL